MPKPNHEKTEHSLLTSRYGWKAGRVWALMLGGLLVAAGPLHAAIWKASGDIAYIHFDAQLNDAQDPAELFIRVENHSQRETIKMTRYFVQLSDSNNEVIKAVAADELVSEDLKQLRKLLPQHDAEINALLREIRADFPQQKIVEVYGRLKEYMRQGRPNSWRTDLQNFLLGKQNERAQDIQAADKIIEGIGLLSKNYFWPNDIAPQGSATGVLFFERPEGKMPPRVFLQIGDQFLGLSMQLTESDRKK